MQLSIIIPVYNVEKYLCSCLESMFRQNLNDNCFEVIIVNDGSKDSSIETIRDIIDAHPNVFVIEQSNQGVSVARNNGLSAAKGDYVFFMDSDDLLIDNSFSDILDDAVQYQPDILIADFVKMTDNDINNGLRPSSTTYTSTVIPEGRAAIEYLNPRECFVWRALYKRSFLNEYSLRFLPGIYFEDILFTIECYLRCRKCIRANHLFYIYRQHPNSIVSAINKQKILDLNTVIGRLWNMRHWNMSPVERQRLLKLVFNTYRIQEWYVSHTKELLVHRKEITSDLKVKAPHLRFSGGMRERVASFCYSFFPNTFLLIRSFF